jgi:hypothetical protein
MQYTAAMPFRGDAGKAFALAVSALTSIGFRLTDRTAASLEMLGPGMNSSRQSPLVGASRVRVEAASGELRLDADLGGVQRMSRFVTLFPPALWLSLGVVFVVLFSVSFGLGAWIIPVVAIPAGLALLWLVLGPLLTRGIRARTCRALDTLLANMVATGEAP